MELAIEYVGLDDIKPYENNARSHGKEDIKAIVKSIKEFGFNDPIGVWHNVIVEGHGRLLAAREAGLLTVPIIRLDDLSDEQRKAYMLAHNKTAELSDWDFEVLASELKDISEFDMSEFGFDLALLNDGDSEDLNDDEVPEVPEVATAKLGDIWKLGGHRLICGDSTDIATIDKLLNGEKADIVFTDPPYNMHYDGAGIIRETVKNVKERIKDIVDFNAFDIAYLASMDVGSIYIFTSKDLIPDYFKIFDGWKFNILTWVKTNNPPMTNNVFLPDIEYLLYFHKGKRIWNNGLKPIDIYRKAYFSSRAEGHEEIGNVHPTMKPLKLISDKLKISTNKNSIVLDLFGGSGSTLVACEQLERRCYMCELDPKYVDVIIKRWEKLTGKKAVLLNDAETVEKQD